MQVPGVEGQGSILYSLTGDKDYFLSFNQIRRGQGRLNSTTSGSCSHGDTRLGTIIN